VLNNTISLYALGIQKEYLFFCFFFTFCINCNCTPHVDPVITVLKSQPIHWLFLPCCLERFLSILDWYMSPHFSHLFLQSFFFTCLSLGCYFPGRTALTLSIFPGLVIVEDVTLTLFVGDWWSSMTTDLVFLLANN